MCWLVETLAWTAVLIALVLLLRRPMARWFGPQAAYALWLLPFLRLLLPPLTLPAWLAPAPRAVPAAEATMEIIVVEAAATASAHAPAVAAPGVDWIPVLLTIWLTGAAVFLVRRFSAYFAMRRELLAEARPVGGAGRIRLVETPATASPVAFGVLDKVVALPPGFMATEDRQARDFAIEHELAHHRGLDLVANFAAQPLFALHWFNPLGYAGWQAMRRDQEAACDARVVARHSREERATYGRVIASFAAGPDLSLAAPMACPVLGDKSIIHRLRSLNMTELSMRRRIAGRAALAAAVLALPLTASISRAERVSAVPAPPAAPVAPAAPLAPLALQAAAVPEAPAAPEAPASPEAPEAPRIFIKRIVKDGAEGAPPQVFVQRFAPGEAGAGKPGERVTMLHGKEWQDLSAEDRAEMEAQLARLREDMGPNGKLAIEMRELRSKLHRDIGVDVARALAETPRVIADCDGEDMVSEGTHDGRQVIRICTRRGGSAALTGLREARRDIAADTDMSAETRARVLRSLDEKISRLETGRD